MSMREAMRQMPASAGRVPEAGGEAASARTSDEALRPRHETANTGAALLLAALTGENLQQAWKRVRSRRAAERVMALLRKMYAKLHLTVNETKSAVASAFGRKFLGFSFWEAPKGEIKCKVAAGPMTTYKQRIRQLPRRSGGRSMAEVVERLRPYVLGWKAYFRLSQTPRV